jgi:hypothetical protein
MIKKRNKMNTTLKYYGILAMVLLFSACEIDSFEEADGIISVTVIDAISGQPLSSEQPKGYMVYCQELSWNGSEEKRGQDFWGKADGTFYNSRIFAGTYNVSLIEGPFHKVTPKQVEIQSGKVAKVEFEVLPYCSFSEVTIEKDPSNAKAIIAKFKVNVHGIEGPEPDENGEVENPAEPATPRHYRLFATSRTPFVGYNNYDDAVSTTDQTLTVENLNTTITIRKTGFLSDRTYYLRLGARCVESPENRYNMTEIIKIEF